MHSRILEPKHSNDQLLKVLAFEDVHIATQIMVNSMNGGSKTSKKWMKTFTMENHKTRVLRCRTSCSSRFQIKIWMKPWWTLYTVSQWKLLFFKGFTTNGLVYLQMDQYRDPKMVVTTFCTYLHINIYKEGAELLRNLH